MVQPNAEKKFTKGLRNSRRKQNRDSRQQVSPPFLTLGWQWAYWTKNKDIVEEWVDVLFACLK